MTVYSVKKIRCIWCGEYHQGKCDPIDRLAFLLDTALDGLDEYLNLLPEPGSRRDFIAKGEYPANANPFVAKVQS